MPVQGVNRLFSLNVHSKIRKQTYLMIDFLIICVDNVSVTNLLTINVLSNRDEPEQLHFMWKFPQRQILYRKLFCLPSVKISSNNHLRLFTL